VDTLDSTLPKRETPDRLHLSLTNLPAPRPPLPKSTHHKPFLARFGFLGHPRAPWILGLGLSILGLIQALHRARQGRCALLKWGPHFETLFEGGELYGVGAEGYPTLPFSLMVMAPFDALGAIAGSLMWALFKIGLAWWIVTRAFRMVNAQQPLLAPGAALFVIVISFRPLLSDITHGNLNILVGATVASAAWSWSRSKPLASGFWLGIGTVLKITPALGLIWYLRKRSIKGLTGMGIGILVGLILPALVVGWSRNLDYLGEWWQQMVSPYLAAERLDLMQTEHINQSLFGVMARYLTDSVAIPAGTAGLTQDLSIALAHLSLDTFHTVHRLACGLVLAILLWCSRTKREDQPGPQVLAEFCLLALAMLFLSERSWKHHYVLLVFPITYLVAHWQSAADLAQRRVAGAAVLLAMLLFGASGTAFLGTYGSKLAESYGAYLMGGLVLFSATGWISARSRGSQ
jgi:alpha-1,2-mannosyltransferase